MQSLLVAGLLVLSLLVGPSVQQCTVQANTDYSTAGDLVTLYQVVSAQACCDACKGFEECTYWSYTSSSQECVVKSARSTVINGVNGKQSGQVANSYTRPTSCTDVNQNTDYFTPGNLGNAPAANAASCCNSCSNLVGCNYWTLDGGTCWMKANLGNKTVATGKTSGTVIPESVSNTPKRTFPLKRGLGVYGTKSCSDIKLLGNVTWVYNWSENPDVLEECYDQLGIQFIPMIHSANSNFDIVYGKSPYLLTFNEPNFLDQANMSPQQAAALWPRVEAVAKRYNMKISSPSASYGGNIPTYNDPINWLNTFFNICSNCQVDFITTHQYDCNAAGLHGAIGNFRQFGKPIWVTEFSCYGSTVAADVNFVQQIIPRFENDVDIERYAWFGSRSRITDPTNNNVFNYSRNALTDVGVAYAGGPAAGTTTGTTSQSEVTTSSDAKALAVPVFLATIATLFYLL